MKPKPQNYEQRQAATQRLREATRIVLDQLMCHTKAAEPLPDRLSAPTCHLSGVCAGRPPPLGAIR